MQYFLYALALVFPGIVKSSILFNRDKNIIIPPGQIPPQPQNCDNAAVVSIDSILTKNTINFPDAGTSYCVSWFGIKTITTVISTTLTAAPTTATITNFKGTLTVYAPAVTSTFTSIKETEACLDHPIGPLTAFVANKEASPAHERRDASAVLATFKPTDISSACLCLGIATSSVTIPITASAVKTVTVLTTTIVPITRTITPTVRTTVTSTVTSDLCPVPTTCDNEGLEYGYYAAADTRKGYGYPASGVQVSPYAAFIPQILLKGKTPTEIGTTPFINIPASGPSPFNIYGNVVVVPGDYYTINHRGYLYAGVSGTYTFSSSFADDIAMVWVGNYAYSGWTRANADAIALQNTAISFQFTLEKGTYTALRFIYANGGGTSSDTIEITDPIGNHVLNSSTVASPYVVRYSCDNEASAPKFEAFQKEIVTPSGPTCNPGPVITSSYYNYNQFFSGVGITLNPNNPGNSNTPPQRLTILDGTLSCLSAAQACADYARLSPGVYYAFDLHYLLNEQEWSCTANYNQPGLASYFNIPDGNVGISFGYQL